MEKKKKVWKKSRKKGEVGGVLSSLAGPVVAVAENLTNKKKRERSRRK